MPVPKLHRLKFQFALSHSRHLHLLPPPSTTTVISTETTTKLSLRISILTGLDDYLYALGVAWILIWINNKDWL
jgi:hypothetical protein